jgi:Family of unknown function (DUF5677)
MTTHVPPPFQIPQTLLTDLTKLGPLLDAATQAHAFGAEIFTNHIYQKTLDTDFKVVAYILFTKGFKTFQSATNLCRCGCGSDAISLCALLFENYIDLQYITQAPVRRSTRFIQYEGVEKYYHLQKILGKKRLPKGVRKMYRAHERKVAPRVAKLLRHFPNKTKGWSQKSIFERANAVRAQLEYHELYWTFCLHKHTVPAVAGAIASGEAELVYGPNIKGVYEAAWYSALCFVKLCDTYQRALSLGLDSRVKSLLASVSAARDLVFAGHPSLCS